MLNLNLTDRMQSAMPADYSENFWKLEFRGSVTLADLRKIAKTITRVKLGFMQDAYRSQVDIPKSHLWATFKGRRSVTVAIYGKFWRPYPDSSPTHWNYCRNLYIGELPQSQPLTSMVLHIRLLASGDFGYGCRHSSTATEINQVADALGVDWRQAKIRMAAYDLSRYEVQMIRGYLFVQGASFTICSENPHANGVTYLDEKGRIRSSTLR